MTAEARSRLVLLDPIDQTALAALRSSYEVAVAVGAGPDQVAGLLRSADVVVLRSGARMDAEAIGQAARLKVIARAGVGLDNVDTAAAASRGIVCFNVPGLSARAVAEFALGLTFAACRNIALADRQIRAGVWDKPGLLGGQLAGRTMGIVGLGAIGSALAELAQAVGLRVIGSLGRADAERVAAFAERGVAVRPVGDVLRASDLLVLAVPLTASTRHLIGRAELAAMPSHAYLINVARGGVVDESALLAALRRRQIAGAALDVLSAERAPSPFTELDNVVLTPHIGAMTRESQQQIGQELVRRIAEELAGWSGNGGRPA